MRIGVSILDFFQFTDRLQQLERGFRDSRRKEGEVIHEKDCYGHLRGSGSLLGSCQPAQRSIESRRTASRICHC